MLSPHGACVTEASVGLDNAATSRILVNPAVILIL